MQRYDGYESTLIGFSNADRLPDNTSKSAGMQRKIIYSLAYIGLIAIAALLMVTNRKSTLRQRNMNFALAEPSLVDRIIISNKTDRLILEKDGDRWRLNGKYPARTETVALFLQSMRRIEVLAPASKSITDTLISRIDKRGNHLKLYHGNKTLLSVMVFHEKEFIPGTYMMDERFRKPFRVGLTGYEGADFDGLFHTGISQWKDNILFDYRPEEITGIRMEYPQNPGQSFVITASPGEELRLDPAESPGEPDKVDPQEVADYLSCFSGVRYILQDSAGYNPPGLKEPFAILTITGKNRDVFRMKAFRIPGTGENKVDGNRYTAILAGDSLPVTVKYSETELVMKLYSDFLKK
jgi:hypothetical protein